MSAASWSWVSSEALANYSHLLSALERGQNCWNCFSSGLGLTVKVPILLSSSDWLPRSREGQRVGILTCGFWHSYFFLKIARSVEFCRARCLALTGDRRKQPQSRLRWQKKICQDVRSGTQDPSFRLLLSKFHDTWGPGDVLAIRSDYEALSLQDEPDSSTPSASD